MHREEEVATKAVITPHEPMYIAGFWKSVVAGYCNDVLAYIASKRVLHEGAYETYRSLIHQTNPLHPGKFAGSLEERLHRQGA